MIHIYACVHICAFGRTSMYAVIYMGVHLCAWVCVHCCTCRGVWMCGHVSVCVYVCTHTHSFGDQRSMSSANSFHSPEPSPQPLQCHSWRLSHVSHQKLFTESIECVRFLQGPSCKLRFVALPWPLSLSPQLAIWNHTEGSCSTRMLTGTSNKKPPLPHCIHLNPRLCQSIVEDRRTEW